MKAYKYIMSVAFCVALGLMFAGCGGDDGGSGPGPTDVTDNWRTTYTMRFQNPNGSGTAGYEVLIDLVQSGTTLSGRWGIVLSDPSFGVAFSGTINGNVIAFTYLESAYGNQDFLTVNATLSGDGNSMSGTIQSQRFNVTYPWSATRLN
jgi:hypothetical protein